MRTDSNPIGAMVEQFLATAYIAHHYRVPAVGWESENQPGLRHRGHAFHKKYYVPSNLVMRVGDR